MGDLSLLLLWGWVNLDPGHLGDPFGFIGANFLGISLDHTGATLGTLRFLTWVSHLYITPAHTYFLPFDLKKNTTFFGFNTRSFNLISLWVGPQGLVGLAGLAFPKVCGQFGLVWGLPQGPNPPFWNIPGFKTAGKRVNPRFPFGLFLPRVPGGFLNTRFISPFFRFFPTSPFFFTPQGPFFTFFLLCVISPFPKGVTLGLP